MHNSFNENNTASQCIKIELHSVVCLQHPYTCVVRPPPAEIRRNCPLWTHLFLGLRQQLPALKQPSILQRFIAKDKNLERLFSKPAGVTCLFGPFVLRWKGIVLRAATVWCHYRSGAGED
ncbi:hypothetical protein GOODEAATRI_018577 [Goodea atripinnis]|uniref:Uncharacterized protein n=1 Tax=Goodea atripinnis TaxID=208336 RepID=A0ABV0NF16_9TELE